jgi:hypothetical protein
MTEHTNAQMKAAIATEARKQIDPLMEDWREKLNKSVPDYMRKNIKKEVTRTLEQEMKIFLERRAERILKEQMKGVVREIMEEAVGELVRDAATKYMRSGHFEGELQAFVNEALNGLERGIKAKQVD